MKYSKFVLYFLFVLIVYIVFIFHDYRESASSKWLRGSNAGYALGYNSLCDITTPEIIDPEMDNKHYARGYYQGRKIGTEDCQKITEFYQYSLRP